MTQFDLVSNGASPLGTIEEPNKRFEASLQSAHASCQRIPEVEALWRLEVRATQLTRPGDSKELLSPELAVIHGASAKRIAEFAAGRVCARTALSMLGFPGDPLLTRKDRVPEWPTGAVGSISHANDFCVAVVASRSTYTSLGVDVELVERVTSKIWPLVLTDIERESVRELSPQLQQRRAAIIFSAKEAYYKCRYSIRPARLGFRDVDVLVHADSFDVTERSSFGGSRPLSVQGGYIVRDGFVITGIGWAAAEAE